MTTEKLIPVLEMLRDPVVGAAGSLFNDWADPVPLDPEEGKRPEFCCKRNFSGGPATRMEMNSDDGTTISCSGSDPSKAWDGK